MLVVEPLSLLPYRDVRSFFFDRHALDVVLSSALLAQEVPPIVPRERNNLLKSKFVENIFSKS